MQKRKNEQGVIIIEATIVFPIVFFVILFLIYFGNVFYIGAKVDAVTDIMAIKGAAYYTDPMLESIYENGSVPLKFKNVRPYRYWFKTNSVESDISKEVKEKLGGVGTGLFAGMEPIVVKSFAKFENKIFYDVFVVEVTYKIQFPIRFIGNENPLILQLSSKAVASATDTDEFIRNTDMILDYYESSGLADKVKDVVGEVKKFFKSGKKMKN